MPFIVKYHHSYDKIILKSNLMRTTLKINVYLNI